MQISDHAHNPAGPMSGQEFLRGLDETERQREFILLLLDV